MRCFTARHEGLPRWRYFLKTAAVLDTECVGAISTAERLPFWLCCLINSIAQHWPRVTCGVRQSYAAAYEASRDSFMPPRCRQRSRCMMGWLKKYRAQLNSAYRARNDVIWLWTWEWCFNSLWFNKAPLVWTSVQAHGEISTGLLWKADSIVQLALVRVAVILFVCSCGDQMAWQKSNIAGKVHKENGFIKGLKCLLIATRSGC